MLHTFFEKKIKPLLMYVGTIGAIAASIAYIILMFVMVIGFKSETTLNQSIVFSVVNAVVGFIIMQFLKIQGVDFAKQLPEATKALDEYNQLKLQLSGPQDTKYHSMTYFWVKTLITDLLVKILTVIIMTSAIIYIVVEGSNDYNMLLLAVVNLILFACFGLISLAKAYDFYKDMHIPYLCNECDKMRNKLTPVLTKDITETITNQSVTLEVSESQGDLTNNNELQIEHIEQNIQ